MAVSYPLAFPTHTGVRSVNLRAVQAQGMTQSIFTYKQQVVSHDGARWEAEISLPPMSRQNAEAWLGWLLSLRGQVGTFLMGDPAGATPMGEAGGTPLVNGASQTGSSLVVDGATPSQSSWLRAGDYFQLGSAASSKLYKVTQDVVTDGGGSATLEIWPNLRSSPSDNDALTVTGAKGLFRSSRKDVEWSVNEAMQYGVTFPVIEAIT